MSNRQPVEDLLRHTYRVVADVPDSQIVHRAVPDATAPDGTSPIGPRPRRQGILVAATVLVLLAAGVGLILAVAGSSPVSRKAGPPAASHSKAPTAATPGTVTVPDDSSSCSPTSGPGSPAATMMAAGTQVASGRIDGRAWTLYEVKGRTGANAIEDGGLVIGGRAYGLCPGYPNPAELQLIDAGPEALVAGVVGYPGLAKVQLFESTVGTFDVGTALPSPSVQLVDGVSFFIGSLPKSACDYPALELNTTSPGVSAEHNLGFGACVPDQIVPISASQGWWQLPPGQFPPSFTSAAPDLGAGNGSGTTAADGDAANGDGANDNSQCTPTTDPSTSGSPATSLTSTASEVASGTVDGQAWTLYAAQGQTGANAIEDGGLVIGGRAYGLCPGYPNPAELQLIDAGPEALVAGVVGYPGLAKVQLSQSTVGTFDVGASLPAPSVQLVDGVSFFIGSLPKSACDYPALELNTTSPGVSAEHNLGFGACAPNQLVPISASQGIWQLAPGQFPANFGGPETAPGAVAPPTAAGAVTVPNDTSDCSPTSGPGSPAASLTSTATQVASGTVDGQAWTLYAAQGQTGANAIEDGGLVLGGRAYGLCPGYPNPAELQLIDAGPEALVAGVVGYPGLAKVQLSQSTVGTFDVGASLPAPSVQLVDGVSFFIGSLPKSACDYPALELNTTSPGVSAEHNLGFGACAPNQLVPISASQGIWQLAPGQFPANF